MFPIPFMRVKMMNRVLIVLTVFVSMIAPSVVCAEGSCNLPPKICINYLSGYAPARRASTCAQYGGQLSLNDCSLADKVGTCVNTQGSDQVMTIFYAAGSDSATARVMCYTTGGQFAP